MIHSINHMNTKRLVHIDSAVIIQLTIYMHKVEFGKDIRQTEVSVCFGNPNSNTMIEYMKACFISM